MKELFERQTRVLIEQFRFELRTVAEQYGSIVLKLSEHDQRFIKIEEKLQQHDLEFVKVHTRFDNLENRFGNLESHFDKLDSQIGTILLDHEHRLKGIEQKL